MSSDMASDELREAVEHIDRARRLSSIREGGYADTTLAAATSNIERILDREFGISRDGKGDDA